ncbi:protein FAM228A [Perognathus longimembris pacificus]|uniref:protein FAM228A n=1 Tax=Perognathus longimembris pacificus TaxID=214514 RepID=UPI00201976C8|nr:protein FAM228A [Perognathus longimembris pacificus]
MAASRASNCMEHFSPEKLKDWPEPELLSSMEVLAREDIDGAVHAILFREDYVVKKMDIYFQHVDFIKERKKELSHKKWVKQVAEPLQQTVVKKVLSCKKSEKKQEKYGYFLKHANKTITTPSLEDAQVQRQQELDDKERLHVQQGTGKRCSALKQRKETEKELSQILFTPRSVVPVAWAKASGRPMKNRSGEMYSAENVSEDKTTDLSQNAFERQYYSSTLRQYGEVEDKTDLSQNAFERQYYSSTLRQYGEAEKKYLVS